MLFLFLKIYTGVSRLITYIIKYMGRAKNKGKTTAVIPAPKPFREYNLIKNIDANPAEKPLKAI